MTRDPASIILPATKAEDMARHMEAPRIDKTATSRLLIGLALCAALMSGAFFLHVRRDAEDHGSVSGASAQLLPGLTLENAEPAGSGLIVTSMESSGPAARAGIAVGDDLVKIDGTPIASLDQASAFLTDHRSARITLDLRRRDAIRMVTLDRSQD
ncbi:PDZ domain-containing protein [Sphingobium sp. AP49]|uniref:PDZ domain-containing protein n=1 Tax=Sphingobium sp. AP49 TaxID=1144307 RepID=UPI00026EDD42|nr:PDZ domain-containing protein [Sphingobium sp. AP49]WHO38543.1 PDZ domain-containing protein [Sphingobium sp. AP49]